MSSHHLPHLVHAAIHEMTEHDGPKGALAGAVGVAGSAVLGLGMLGLALTPFGLALAAGGGALAGAKGLFKKRKETPPAIDQEAAPDHADAVVEAGQEDARRLGG